jgi:hypothetical protein
MTEETPAHRFLTDEEVAERLRCTVRGVRRLRLLGRLRYVPGRPPQVDGVDLDAYIEKSQAILASISRHMASSVGGATGYAGRQRDRRKGLRHSIPHPRQRVARPIIF